MNKHPSASSRSIMVGDVLRFTENGQPTLFKDELSNESPLEIRIGNRTVAITMRTPGNDDDLVAGFLATEGVIESPGQIKAISACPTSAYPENTIRADLRGSSKPGINSMERYGTVTASCGICGKVAIESILETYSPLKDLFKTSPAVILSLPAKLQKAQTQFERTGGLHAAAIFDLEGQLQVLREDVGRHNATDKTLGALFRQGQWPLSKSVLLVSGRLSYEILQKAMIAGIPVVAGISAPSTLAVEFARKAGQTLIGFLRNGQFNVYSHIHRIEQEETIL